MSYATEFPHHIHISEREPDGSWEDCTFDSGLEWYRDTVDSSKPATHAEAQLLRKASGKPPTGGSNIGDFIKGVKVRYGKTLTGVASNQGVIAALKPGQCAILQGSMKAFGPGHHLSVHDRNFDGGHAVWLARSTTDHYWWCDPEAPKGSYRGVTVTPAEVTAFVKAFPTGQMLIGTIQKPIAPPPPPKVYTQEQLDSAVEAAVAPLVARLNNIHDLSNI
jgi:hypothetical protein